MKNDDDGANYLKFRSIRVKTPAQHNKEVFSFFSESRHGENPARIAIIIGYNPDNTLHVTIDTNQPPSEIMRLLAQVADRVVDLSQLPGTTEEIIH